MGRQRPSRPRSTTPPPPTPLPGGRSGVPGGMHQYVVNLAPPEAQPNETRRDAVDAYTRAASAFVDRARQELAARGLSEQVEGIGEAFGFPVVTLTATPAVAEVLRQLPGVETVYEDDAGSLGFTG